MEISDSQEKSISKSIKSESEKSGEKCSLKEDKISKDLKEKIIFDKKTFYENLIFFVDVLYNKTNETENYKNLILEYGGQVIDTLRKKCDYVLYNEGKVSTLEKALKFEIKVINPFWVVDSIREKEFQPFKNYEMEVRVSDLLLRKRKYDNIRSESQESVESQKGVKKPKKEKSNVQRKSKFFFYKNKLAVANTIKRKNKENNVMDASLISQSNLIDESYSSEMPTKKNIFSDKTNLKNISDNLLESNKEITIKNQSKNKKTSNFLNQEKNTKTNSYKTSNNNAETNSFKYSKEKTSNKNNNTIAIIDKLTRERFLPEVIDEVDDSKNEISMLVSNTKLNTSNNNIAMKPILEKPENYSKFLNNEITDLKIEAENKISTSKQKKFITMDSFIGKEGIRKNQSKEKADTLKKNLKSNNDESAKSHNLLSFFKTMDIRKDEENENFNGEVKNKNKNNLHESNENNKKFEENTIRNLNENRPKSSSEYNKDSDHPMLKREKSLSTNKALINKFLLDSKSKFKESPLQFNVLGKSQHKNNLSNVLILGGRTNNNIDNIKSNNLFVNNLHSNNNANKSNKNNHLERKRNSKASNGNEKLSMSFTKDSNSMNLSLENKESKMKENENRNKLVKPLKKPEPINKDIPLRIASIGLLDAEKLKIKSFELNSKNVKYLGETLINIEDADIVVVKSQGAFAFQDIRFIYAIFYKLLKYDGPLSIVEAAKEGKLDISKKIVRYKFFIEMDKKANITHSSFDNYLAPLSEINFESIFKYVLNNKLPLQGYRIQPDSSLYVNMENQKDEIKYKIICSLIKVLGATVVDHIRQSDFCIIEAIDSSTVKVPPQVMPLKLSFLIDALISFKQPDYEMLQYKPQDKNKKKLRK